MISKVKHIMEHNSCLRTLVPICRKIGIVHLLHRIKGFSDRLRNRNKRKEFQEFYEQHKKKFDCLFELLEDDLSKETLHRVLEFRKSWKIKILSPIIVEPQYFQSDIFEYSMHEIMVDGGAYVGDTVEEFIKCMRKSRGGYTRIYAWEPDEINIKQMQNNLKRYKNVQIIPYGMWEKKEELSFSKNGNAGSKITVHGEEKICVDSIDHVHAQEKVTLIKMDIEGSEKQALIGAENIIRRDRPKLAICIYHNPEDLFEIPFLIKKMVPEYKLYIRHHSDTYAETVVYATI